jgi:fatty acid desaturase
MVKLTIVEDRPTPKEVYNWRVYFFASMACWASVMIGYDVSPPGLCLSLIPRPI